MAQKSRPKSLRRQAQREVEGHLGRSKASFIKARFRQKRSTLHPNIETALEPVTLFVVCFGMIFAPVPIQFSRFHTEERAVSFLSTIWQVTASVIALSVAIILFAFQAVSAQRASRIREFVKASRVLSVAFLGVTTLIVQSYVLLGVGQYAPGGWPGTWATLLGIASFCATAYLIARSATLVDPSFLHRYRLRAASESVEQEIYEDATTRIALNLLEEFGKEDGFQSSTMPLARDDDVRILAGRRGSVTDINLRKLQSCARRVRDANGQPLTICAYLGARVSEKSTVALHKPTAFDVGAAELGLVVFPRSKSRYRSDLEAAVISLHSESIDAIRGSRQAELEDVHEVYENLLLAFPRAWAEFGQRYNSDVAGGITIFSTSTVDLIARNLYEEAVIATTEGRREAIFAAITFPTRVAIEGFDLDASALCNRMLSLAVPFAALSPAEQTGLTAQMLYSYLSLSVFEYLNYTVAHSVSDDRLPDADRIRASEYLAQGLSHTIGLLKLAVDERHSSWFRENNNRWSDLLRHWLQDQKTSPPEDLANQLAATVRAAKERNYLSLYCWTLRELRRNPEDSELQEITKRLLNSVGEYEDFVATAYEIGGEHRDPLSRWLLDEQLAENQAGLVSVRQPVAYAIALAILAGKIDLTDTASPWAASWKSELIGAVESLICQVDLLTSLGIDHWPDLPTVETWLDQSIEEQARLHRRSVAAAELDSGKVAHFKAEFYDGWRKARLAVPLLEWAEAVVEEAGELPSKRISYGHVELADKQWFTNEDPVHGGDNIARHFGAGIADGENQIFRELIEDLNGHRKSDASTAAETISALRSEGYQPSVVLLPRRWSRRWYGSFIEPLAGRSIDLPPSLQSSIVGTIEDIPVLRSSLVESAAFVVDLSRFARWHRWPTDEQEVFLGLREYSQESAEEALAQSPELFPELDQQERVLELRGRLGLDMHEYATIEILDKNAAARIPLADLEVDASVWQ